MREKHNRMYEAIEGTFIASEFTEDEIKKMMQEEIVQSE